MEAIAAGARAQDLESLTLEFKRVDGPFEEVARLLAEAAACLANTDGGTIVGGVDNKAVGTEAFVGCPYPSEALRRRIWEMTDPKLAVAVEEVRYGNAPLVIVTVPQGLEVHTVRGKATHRVGTGCEPMSGAQQARLIDDRRGQDWSAMPSDAPAEAVSPVALDVARRLLRQHPDPQRQRLAALPDPDLLRALGVVDGEHRLLRAGELLFVDDAQQQDVVVYQHRRSPAGEITELQRLPRALLPAFQRVMELVNARIDRTPLLLPSGQQLTLADLPEWPVREALANAISHRDWRLPHPVSIEHAPTRLVVDSPGPLVAGVTLENILTHPSKPRNRVLTEAVRKIGLAEQAGVGIDRMHSDMIRSGHAPPRITADDYVRVTLVGGAPNKPLARYIASLPNEVAEDADAMLTLFTLLTDRVVTARGLEPVLQKPAEEIEAVLRSLATDEIGMLEPTRETTRLRLRTYRLRATTQYELGSAVRYRTNTSDEIDRRIVAMVEETGGITNRVVQVLFEVGVERASRILADLVDREILEKTSAHERGPGVTYGPGPRFPRKGR